MSTEAHPPERAQDHPHEAPEGRPWDRCTVCGLAAAAHASSLTPYEPRST